MIKEITISGFRGINSPLKLTFTSNNGKPQSLAIYGRNGTGKSSITDAWECFHSEKIGHLTREGAEQSSYPNKHSSKDQSFVEVNFSDTNLGSIQQIFNFDKVTKPNAKGNISLLRQRAPHPCHIRFEDLTRFVYLNKADKYDQLALFMGFSPQVEFQKSLRKVEKQYEAYVFEEKKSKERISKDLISHIQISDVSLKSIINALNLIIARNGYPNQKSIEGINSIKEKIRKTVEIDPNSQHLSNLRTLDSYLKSIILPNNLQQTISELVTTWHDYEAITKELIDLIMIDLFEHGEKVILKRIELGYDRNICPLCGSVFTDGNLLEHVGDELSKLNHINKVKSEFDNNKKLALESCTYLCNCSQIEQFVNKNNIKITKVSELIDNLNELLHIILKIKKNLEATTDSFSKSNIDQILEMLATHSSQVTIIDTLFKEVGKEINDGIVELSGDTKRARLVQDYSDLNRSLELWEELEIANNSFEETKQISGLLHSIVDDYVAKSNLEVNKRFKAISSNVTKYFNILEEHNPGITKPVIKLLENQDRAVELEVEFFGESIYPAYKYLSESQLNSFGLSIFLASAKYFNKDFRFIILDDVINSFDGYKRPQVIKLLNQEFSDFQFLLLTHDSVWRDQLFEICPSWKKREFKRFEPKIGPIDLEGYTQLEKIEQYVFNGEPVIAGQSMGPFLERKFQILCERFEVLIKYNIRNEYTLDPLIDRFRIRLKEKLGTNHPLISTLEALQNNIGFRNLCSHWKNPDIQVTVQEMQSVIDDWKVFESLVRCSECNSYLKYKDDAFICDCGLKLVKKTII